MYSLVIDQSGPKQVGVQCLRNIIMNLIAVVCICWLKLQMGFIYIYIYIYLFIYFTTKFSHKRN
jgi:hypothetical protein